MKLCKPAKQLTAALVAGAMALSLCAPALAEAPLPGAAAAVAAPTESTPDGAVLQQEENATNSVEGITINDKVYTTDPSAATGGIISYDIGEGQAFYTPSKQQLNLVGPFTKTLTISAPGVDIVMTSDNGQVVTAENGAALIIQNARQLSVTGRSAGPLIACSAVRINCADDVSIQNSGSGMAVSTGGFEVQNAKNVFVSGASENAVVSSGGTNSITCSEKLIIQNANGPATGGAKFTASAAAIEITGNSNFYLIGGGEASLTCSGGDLVLTNTGTSTIVGGGSFTAAGAKDVTITGAASYSLLSSGQSSIDCTGNVILENTGTGGITSGGTFQLVHANNVTISGASTNALLASGGGSSLECSGKIMITNTKGAIVNGNIFTAIAHDMEITGNATDRGSMFSCTTVDLTGKGGDLSLTNNGSAPIVGGTSFTVAGAKNVALVGNYPSTGYQEMLAVSTVDIDCTGTLEVTNHDGGTIFSRNSFTIENAADVKLTTDGKQIAAGGSFVVKNAGNVTIINNSSMLPALGGGLASIDCTGNLSITNTNGPAVQANFTVTNAENVSITGKCNGFGIVLNTYDNAHSINCSGEVKIINEGSGMAFRGDAIDFLYCSKVMLTTAGTQAAASSGMNYTPPAGMTWNVQLDDTVLKGTNADEVCTLGKGDELQAVKTVVITPVYPPHDATPEWKSDEINHWQECSICHEKLTDPELHDFEDGICSVCGAPDTAYVPDVPGAGGSSTVGTVMAGVAIGGAAAFVGYEVVTDILLSKLLPEGAAIPANRGELAMLIWTQKGKPEPAAEPAFTDVSDTELAKAAQWCVEQGLLTAEDGKFEPDGWTPKWRVIQVWNQAFPKE